MALLILSIAPLPGPQVGEHPSCRVHDVVLLAKKKDIVFQELFVSGATDVFVVKRRLAPDWVVPGFYTVQASVHLTRRVARSPDRCFAASRRSGFDVLCFACGPTDVDFPHLVLDGEQF